MNRALRVQREIGLNNQNKAKYDKIFRQRELNEQRSATSREQENKENRILDETQLSKRNKDGDANNYLFLYHISHNKS